MKSEKFATIKIDIGPSGLGSFWIDDKQIRAVTEFSLSVEPGREFVKATFTILGNVEADIVVYDENLTATVLGHPDPRS